ncbi:putative stigma-specific protein Stig1 [Medicago truncatula]|uniref:Putative stigma-specific protein Stig1 n=1 Tax=Medicago truncatula TaxID=3880 RepID=A0A396H1V8_MEDTR|nr:putative stigma-specific protein Stig1 [Medicago truncatula]
MTTFLHFFNMSTLAIHFVTIVALLLIFQIKIEANPISLIPKDEVKENPINTNVVVKVGDLDQESYNCALRPWICSAGENPPRSVCCRNRCVDVTSDADNCGFCGIRCPFIGNWQCCNRFCANINFSPFNCGACGIRCLGCLFGRCPSTNPAQPPFLPLGCRNKMHK